MVSVLGTRAGGPAVDYTVNPAVGFPHATGPEGSSDPVPCPPGMDCITGQAAAMAVLAAERHRRITGEGQLVELALKDVALAMLGNLGILGEVMVNGIDRPKYGNALYGAFGQDFPTADGRRIMVVALTAGSGRACSGHRAHSRRRGVGERLGLRLELEGDRFKARKELEALFAPWFAARRVEKFATAFDRAGVTWSEFRSFAQAVAEDPDLSAEHPMFELLDQPGIGRHLMPGLPIEFGAFAREAPRAAPILGQHTDEILAESWASAAPRSAACTTRASSPDRAADRGSGGPRPGRGRDLADRRRRRPVRGHGRDEQAAGRQPVGRPDRLARYAFAVP